MAGNHAPKNRNQNMNDRIQNQHPATMNAFQIFLAARPFGFVTAKDMPELILLYPKCECLVRCGNGRFVCPADLVAYAIGEVQRCGDYVRDVSVTTREHDRAALWTPPADPLVSQVQQKLTSRP